MMRNEQRKDAVSPIVVDGKGVFVTDAPNGFENVRGYGCAAACVPFQESYQHSCKRFAVRGSNL